MDPSTTPAGLPPAGVLPNFTDPVNYAPNLIACNIVLLVVSVIVVSLRVLSRTVLTDWRLGWDDILMIVALVGTAIFGAFVVVTTKYGLGKHIWDVPQDVYSPHYLWWIMATFAACPASYYFVKMSILFFYLRVFQLQSTKRYMIYALMVYCTIYYWVAFSTVVGLCNAKNKKWDITVTMNCFGYGKLVFAIGGLDLVADAMLLAFPIPMVLKLQISRGQRVYLLIVFLAGLAASAACAIRIALGVQSRGNLDATMAQYHVVTLFCIEHYLAVIAGCMPTLGPFYRWLRPSHWRHQNLDRAQHHDNDGGFQRVWPKKHKPSVIDSLMNDSLVTEPIANKGYAFGAYEMQPPLSRQPTDRNRGKSDNMYGPHKSDEFVDVEVAPPVGKAVVR